MKCAFQTTAAFQWSLLHAATAPSHFKIVFLKDKSTRRTSVATQHKVWDTEHLVQNGLCRRTFASRLTRKHHTDAKMGIQTVEVIRTRNYLVTIKWRMQLFLEAFIVHLFCTAHIVVVSPATILSWNFKKHFIAEIFYSGGDEKIGSWCTVVP